MKKPKTWKYHRSHSFKDENGIKHHFITQLYKLGVYGILDGRSEMQGNWTPGQLVSLEKKQKEAEEKGNISELEFGTSISVTTDKDGLYIEKEE